MYSLYIILSLLLSYCNVVLLSSTDQSVFTSKTQKMNYTINSTERSANSDNPEKNGDLMSNTDVPFCARSRYRTIDGSCNNLLHPLWGTPNRPYGRLLPYNYGNGINSFPKTITGHDLPNARNLRLKIFRDKAVVDKNYTLITMQWGQIVAHDMSLGTSKTGKGRLTCCNTNGTFANEAKTDPRCAPIEILRNDPVYAPHGKICMNFIRTRTTKDINYIAPEIPVQPLSSVTSFMDLSLVYGNNKSQADAVRAGFGGRLLTSMRNYQEWPPQNPQADHVCDMLKKPTSPCYLAGDIRVNQTPQLAMVQVILLREHNHIADALHKINAHWDDEKLYQETRRILIAMHQQITYYEYLPTVIGIKNMVRNKLIYLGEEGYVNDYDPNVDPSVYNEHASGAFRLFHSSIRGSLRKYQENRKLVGRVRMSDHFNNPAVLEEGDNFDNLARGVSTQLQSYSDQYFDKEITQYFHKGANKYGDDLRAIDIQRGRDHGLPSYVDTRAVCGLSVPKTFNDMSGYMSAKNILRLTQNYESLEDIEMPVGGSLEYQIPETQVGPTFKCIITKQFLKTRTGDRFFFENGADPDTAFTSCQLQSIRQGASISRLLCDNVDSIESMQPKAFRKISHKNKLVPCDDLPSVDLTLWKEEYLK